MVHLDFDGMERWGREVLLKGVSPEGTEARPVGAEQGYVSTALASVCYIWRHIS